jgi:proteasome-associated ATPase
VLIEEAIRTLFARNEDTRFLEVSLRSGRQEVLCHGDLVSGAIIDSVVQRAKETAIKRAIAGEEPETGISSVDLRDAIMAEYQENEIFPPTDSVEDWLKLLDYDPENVVRVAPVRREEKNVEQLPGSVI